MPWRRGGGRQVGPPPPFQSGLAQGEFLTLTEGPLPRGGEGSARRLRKAGTRLAFLQRGDPGLCSLQSLSRQQRNRQAGRKRRGATFKCPPPSSLGLELLKPLVQRETYAAKGPTRVAKTGEEDLRPRRGVYPRARGVPLAPGWGLLARQLTSPASFPHRRPRHRRRCHRERFALALSSPASELPPRPPARALSLSREEVRSWSPRRAAHGTQAAVAPGLGHRRPREVPATARAYREASFPRPGTNRLRPGPGLAPEGKADQGEAGLAPSFGDPRSGHFPAPPPLRTSRPPGAGRSEESEGR